MGKRLKNFQQDVRAALSVLSDDAFRQECIAMKAGLKNEERTSMIYRNGIEVARKAVEELISRYAEDSA